MHIAVKRKRGTEKVHANKESQSVVKKAGSQEMGGNDKLRGSSGHCSNHPSFISSSMSIRYLFSRMNPLGILRRLQGGRKGHLYD